MVDEYSGVIHGRSFRETFVVSDISCQCRVVSESGIDLEGMARGGFTFFVWCVW